MRMHNEENIHHSKETNQDNSRECKSLEDANMDTMEETPQ